MAAAIKNAADREKYLKKELTIGLKRHMVYKNIPAVL